MVAAASSALAWPGVKGRSVAWGIAVAGGWALAFPLHERIHLLGDTQLRTDTLESAALGTISLRFGDLAGELHASPLDVVANLYVPLGLTHLGSSGSAVSWTCFAEWLLYLSGVARVVKRLGPPPEARIPLTAALALSGLLEVFAGYLDSSGLILAAAAWWWSELLAPLDRDRQAARVWVAGLALLLTHRMGVAMLAPQLWRALGASLGRVETLASAPGHVQGPQLGHLYRARGNWYMSHLQWRQAGASFDRSFELNPNPKIEILATRSWLMARDPFSARRSLGRARAAGPLPPDWERKSRSYELVIQRMEEAYARAREQAAAPR